MRLQQNVQLANYTNYRIGGPARFFVEAKKEEEIIEAVFWAKENNLPYFILGGGTNLLVSDNGYNGMIICINTKGYKFSTIGKGPMHKSKTQMFVSAGADMQDLVWASIYNGLKGLEWAGGLPGQLGGAIRGNAGAFGGEMKDIVYNVRALTPEGEIKTFSNAGCHFNYRTSIFKEEPGYVILSVTLNFEPGKKYELKASANEFIKWRASKHPGDYGNCGSVFKNKPFNELPKDIFNKHSDIRTAVRDGQVATAYFIDRCNLKNFRVGGAEVSEKHPNFLINKTGSATAEDVIILKSIVKSRVLDRFGVLLEEEVHYLA